MKESESLHEHTILIIEDHPEIARAMAGALKSSFNVRLAKDAERGLMEITRLKIDLVLLDACLPGRSGVEFCKMAKADPEFKFVPIIMVSGLRSPGDQARAVRAEAEAYLTNPFFGEELRSRVEAAIRESKFSERRRTNRAPSLPETLHFAMEAESTDIEIDISPN